MADHRPAVSAPPWFDEIDTTVTAPDLLRMGLSRMPADAWLIVDDQRVPELALKSQLLEDHPEDTVAWLDDACEEEAKELLLLVVDDLATYHDLHVNPDPSRHPIDAAGRLVQEDLTLLRDTPEGTILVAGSVCFPSGWHLRKKLGRDLFGVHEPVANYAGELRAKVDTIFKRLTPDRPLMRRNWFIYDDRTPFQPDKPSSDQPVQPLARFVIRSERETMRRLPITGASVFTIRTQQAPLAALGSRPDVAADMLRYFALMPDVAPMMKGMERYEELVLSALRSLAAGDVPDEVADPTDVDV